MSTVRITIPLGTWLIAFAMSLPAQAIAPAIKCEAAKVKEVGKYGFCQMKTESKELKKGIDLPADFDRCDIKFSRKWGKIERKGAESCPTLNDEAVIQSAVKDHAADLVLCLRDGRRDLLFPVHVSGGVRHRDPSLTISA